MNTIQDRIKGSLIGGAIGDVLEYTQWSFFGYCYK